MSDGQILKPDKDFTKEADKQILEAQELAKVESILFRDLIYTNRKNVDQPTVCARKTISP